MPTQAQTQNQTNLPNQNSSSELPPGIPVLDVKLKRPHPMQQQFIDSPSKRKMIRAGRRSGKTTGIAIYAVLAFLQKLRVLYATPTGDQIKKFWFEVTNALALGIEVGALYKNETEHIIEKPGTEQRIRAKTAWNADTLRGDHADLLILDEWQLMDESAWEDVGAPMLIDNNGSAVFIYTPPSLHSKSVTKARDPRHAAKMYERAKNDKTGRWATFHFTSYDNPFLSADGLREVTADMTQASMKREILAEDSKDVPGALWKQEMIDLTRISIDQLPADLETVVVGVDPTGSTTNEAGIVCTARGPAPIGWTPTEEMLRKRPDLLTQKHGYVVEDGSLLAPLPSAWASRAVNMFFERKADHLLGERNYGGDMVQSTIRQVEQGDRVNYTDANATRGKMVRAEPVAAAYESGLFHHVGIFPELEDEMTSYVPGNTSPNRMDAMVWGGLRLIEGMEVYGLVDFLSKGGLEETIKQLAVKSANGNGQAKPVVVAEPTERCPKCNCKTVQNIGNQKRCIECGEQWWPNGSGPAVNRGMNRAEFLARGSRGR